MRDVNGRQHKNKPTERKPNRTSGSQDDGPERFSRFIIGLLLISATAFVLFRVATALYAPD